MKTLRILMLMIIISLFMNSCTDLISDDEQDVLDTIENTQGTENAKFTGEEGGGNNGGGKGG